MEPTKYIVQFEVPADVLLSGIGAQRVNRLARCAYLRILADEIEATPIENIV